MFADVYVRSVLASSLLTKYKAATFTLTSEKRIVEDYKAAHRIDDETIKGWIQEEREYLQTLVSEPEYDVDAVRYVELLDQLAEVQ